jgi:hypothetical protein
MPDSFRLEIVDRTGPLSKNSYGQVHRTCLITAGNAPCLNCQHCWLAVAIEALPDRWLGDTRDLRPRHRLALHYAGDMTEAQ